MTAPVPARPPPVPRRHPSRPSLAEHPSSPSIPSRPHNGYSSSSAGGGNVSGGGVSGGSGPSPSPPDIAALPTTTHTNKAALPPPTAASTTPTTTPATANSSLSSPSSYSHRDSHPYSYGSERTGAVHSSSSDSNHYSYGGDDHDDEPPSPTTMRHSTLGLGAANVGLGPVLLDFKDWVKAGQTTQASPRDASSTVVAGASEDKHPRHRTADNDTERRPPNRTSYSYSSNLSAEAEYAASVRDSYSPLSVGSSYGSSSPQGPPRMSPIPRTMPTSASRQSISSLSIDSSHSPKGFAGRASSRLSDRPSTIVGDSILRTGSTTIPRRTSHDLSRELSRLSVNGGSGRASRSGHTRHSHSPLGSPINAGGQESPLGAERSRPYAFATSPPERRFSRPRLTDAVTEETVEEIRPAEADADSDAIDDRIREAEEKLARRALLRDTPNKRTSLHQRINSPLVGSRADTPPYSNGHTPLTDLDPDRGGTNGSATFGTRRSIPPDFNGRMVTPSPSDGYRANMVDLNSSPSSPFQGADAPSPRRTTAARPASVLDHRSSVSRPFHESPFSLPRRRELPPRARPESVLETSADRMRYDSGHGYGSTRRMSNYVGGGEDRSSQRLSTLLGNDRELGVGRHSRDLGATFGVSSRDSISSQREVMYSPQRGSRDSYSSPRNSGLSEFGQRESRESREFPREPRDMSSASRIGLSPNDSVSVVGSRNEYGTPTRSEYGTPSRVEPGSARKDPLEMIRRLEETRNKHNRQWSEDRSASAMGKYGDRETLTHTPSRMEETPQPLRPGSRMSTTSRLGPRATTSLGSVRDLQYAGAMVTPRTAPVLRNRTRTDSESSTMDSPLMGRTSRASGSLTGVSTEPRVTRRSQTSVGGLSLGGRSGGSSDQASTDHGRNLVDAARMLEVRAEIPADVLAKLTTAAAVAERANTGVRAAQQIASELAIDVELEEGDSVSSVRDRLPRLAVTLREASRASDQAVRDLTEALLAARNTAAAASTPGRPPKRAAQVNTATEGHRRTVTLDSPAAGTRQSSGVMPSPLQPRSDQAQRNDSWTSSAPPTSRLEPLSPPYEIRHLNPIEQSPPRERNHVSPVRGSVASGAPAAAAGAAPYGGASGATGATPGATSGASHGVSAADGRGDDHGADVDAPVPTSGTSWGVGASAGITQSPKIVSSPSLVGSSPATSPRAPEWHPTQAAATSEPRLRKKGSTATVRANSFMPSHPPEPTTALSSSPAYSTPSAPSSGARAHHHDISSTEVQSPLRHKSKRDSVASATSSLYSAASGAGAGAGAGASPTPASPTLVHPVTGSEITRTGTFGAAQGASLRASVSERFRKHLNGE